MNKQACPAQILPIFLCRLSKYVCDLLAWGISSDNSRLLVEVYGRQLCQELNVPADYLNTRFFPTADVIRYTRTRYVEQLREHKVSSVIFSTQGQV